MFKLVFTNNPLKSTTKSSDASDANKTENEVKVKIDGEDFKLVFNNNPLKCTNKASNDVNKPENEVIVKLDNDVYLKKPDGSLIPIQEVKVNNP